LVKVRIRTLVSIRRDPKKRNYLKPGDYDAEVNKGGTLCVHTKFGDYMPLPGQFEFIRAPSALLKYWRATFLLLEAQAEYKRSNSYQAVTRLTSVQGSHDAAKREFEKLFIEKEVQ
jgi:aminoglycoside N3'-acetyltransferase